MCVHGTVTMVDLCKPRKSGRTTIPVDACISEEVQKMNNVGIVTLGSCCGHGDEDPHVLVDEVSLSLLQSTGYEAQPYIYANGEDCGVYRVIIIK